MTIYLTQLTENKSDFPDPTQALADPDGLLTMGGCLAPERLFNAYQQGIFPWFNQGESIFWWSPSERATIKAGNMHISKSMAKTIRKHSFTITINNDFSAVINACAKPRKIQAETWINSAMIQAYQQLHQQGKAHSIEVWQGGELVGGLYGVCIGSLFCGESMFSIVNNSSKIAFIALHQHFQKIGGKLIDCQMMTEHLKSLGVSPCLRALFLKQLKHNKRETLKINCWHPQQIVLMANANS